MKKYLIILMSLIFCCVFIGCNNSNNTGENTSNETANVDDESINTEGSDVLVAYFSQTGNTQKVAEYISSDLNANLFQIIPVNPYTDDDLDYNSDSSRSKVESADDSARPEIEGKVEDMSKFSYVFLGYPIWYSEAPKVISTFLESYDFSGKTIIPFCTSSSSPIGESASNLEGLAPGADWLDGMRFPSDVTQEEVTDWVKTLNIKE